MITNRSFAFTAQNSLTPILKISGIVRGSLMVIIENNSGSNQLTYKIQESSDGISWSDKAFTTSDNSTVVTFVIDPDSAHTFRSTPTRTHTRIVASGAAPGHLAVMYSTASDPDTNVEVFA